MKDRRRTRKTGGQKPPVFLLMDNVIYEHKGAKNRKISGPFCALWEMSRRLSFCVFLFIGGLYHSQLHTELIQFIAAGRTDPLISDHHSLPMAVSRR
jgi:hypothetical protein